MWDNLHIANKIGSEGGIIIKDEEYKNSCRITLEKCPRYYAITCGVYGAMAHTAFCNSDDYKRIYDEMKNDLQEFIDRDSTSVQEMDFYDYFTRKY